ncbi:MAG TPA: GntR family transcriptional regulator [Candidatus Nanopelagicales bacterium]|nr:GntR family transcriptional regulator [Candidatus Nanopelagicales bacterium]
MGRSRRADEVTRAVLLAPLRMAGPGWSSRAIAAEAGVSQSMVARVWAEAYAAPHDPLLGRDLRLVAVAVSRGNSLLVLADRPGGRAPATSFMRSPLRPALQTALAADLLRAPRDAADLEHDVALLRELVAEDDQQRVAITRMPLVDVTGVHQVVVHDAAEWQALLAPLVRATSHQSVDELRSAQLRLMAWSRTRRGRFQWTVAAAAHPEAVAPAPGVPQPLSDRIAQQAFEQVLERVASGQLAAGDRVTEASLARGLHTSRAYVREAVRSLAAQGLIELEQNRGAVVPRPRRSDVIDTYAARRAMGALLVERAAQSATRDLSNTEAALHDMLAIAETGDARACGDADLRFQDALAGATSMRHVPGMFRTLTSQVLLLTTVMGLRYVYSIPRMCRDDIEILAAVQRRDASAAVELWHRKIDDAVEHMATQL